MPWLTHFLLHLCYKDSIEILYSILQKYSERVKTALHKSVMEKRSAVFV